MRADTGVVLSTVQEIKELETKLKVASRDFIHSRRDSAAAGVASPVTCPEGSLANPGRSKSVAIRSE